MNYERTLMKKMSGYKREGESRHVQAGVGPTIVEKLQNLLGNSTLEAIMTEYAGADGTKPSDEADGLPSDLKEEYEEKYSLSLDDVKIHYDSDKPESLNAYAYTQGNDVYLGPGQEKYITHELNHVIQQKQGIVSVEQYLNGRPISMDPALEAQADSGYRLNKEASNRRSQNNEGVIQLKSKNMRNSMQHFLDGININKTTFENIDKLISLLSEHDKMVHENTENLHDFDNVKAKSDNIFAEMTELLKSFVMMQEDRDQLIEIAQDKKYGSGMFRAVEEFFDSIDISMSSVDDLSSFDENFRQYDALEEDRVDECETLLMNEASIINRLNISNAGKMLLVSLIDKEMRDLHKMHGPMKIDPRLAYDHMASQGILWRLPFVADRYGYPKKGRIPDNIGVMSNMVAARVSGRGLPNARINGLDFFGRMSQLNVGDTENLKSCMLNSDEEKKAKYDTLLTKIIKLLVNNTRISHYTGDDKFKLINKSNGIISKLAIERSRKDEMAEAEHNTQSVDEYGYANTGFVFAYMEVDGAPPSSNHRYGKLRISHRTRDIKSVLESYGMIELFDIMQGAKESWHSASQERINVESVRKSVTKIDPVRDEISDRYLQSFFQMERPNLLDDNKQRVFKEIMTTIIPQSMQLDRNAFTYGEGVGSRTVPQMLHNNFFVGRDIIPGLAAKAAIELIMLEDAGLAIPTDDEQLLKRILSGLYKIQVMLPGGMPLYGADVDRAE